MNRTSNEKRAQIIACLAEGNSMRATARLTGAAIITDHVWSIEAVVNLIN